MCKTVHNLKIQCAERNFITLNSWLKKCMLYVLLRISILFGPMVDYGPMLHLDVVQNILLCPLE